MPLDDPAPSAAAHVLVRVWLPDRPGALGLVASRIGAVRGDIVGVDVLERGTDIAVDEFAVDLPGPDLVATLVREVEEVDGVSVEEVRLVGHFPDARLDALESALAAGVVMQPPRPGMLSFSHALIREAVYEEMSMPRQDRRASGLGPAPGFLPLPLPLAATGASLDRKMRCSLTCPPRRSRVRCRR